MNDEGKDGVSDSIRFFADQKLADARGGDVSNGAGGLGNG